MRHVFNFEGGEDLTTMGAAWFVSYCYYSTLDSAHRNWRAITTAENRASVYKNTKYCTASSGESLHRYYLERVLEMNIKKLNKNTLGLQGAEIKAMARELLNSGRV